MARGGTWLRPPSLARAGRPEPQPTPVRPGAPGSFARDVFSPPELQPAVISRTDSGWHVADLSSIICPRNPGHCSPGRAVTVLLCFCPQNVMPLSAGLFQSEHRNPIPQCPPRLHVQCLSHVLWSRMPNQFLKVDVARVSERQGWLVQCVDPLQFMSLHIPEENRSVRPPHPHLPGACTPPLPRGSGWPWGHKLRVNSSSFLVSSGDVILYIPS